MTTPGEDVNVWEPYLTYAIYLAGTVQVIAIIAAFLLPRQSSAAVQVRFVKVLTKQRAKCASSHFFAGVTPRGHS